jgi:uncharacterized protein (DUF2141 family)
MKGKYQLMLKIANLVMTTLLTLSFTKVAYAEPTISLTVVVNGIRNPTGEICMRVYNSEKGFPSSDKSGIKSGCTKITGNSIKQVFSGLKPGNYAVAVVDDQNGDHKLNKDFFGIPQEGFGISKNPPVSISTGAPKFNNASFKVDKNTSINIFLKYSLDP